MGTGVSPAVNWNTKSSFTFSSAHLRPNRGNKPSLTPFFLRTPSYLWTTLQDIEAMYLWDSGLSCSLNLIQDNITWSDRSWRCKIENMYRYIWNPRHFSLLPAAQSQLFSQRDPLQFFLVKKADKIGLESTGTIGWDAICYALLLTILLRPNNIKLGFS
jgi:hypothetical protein